MDERKLSRLLDAVPPSQREELLCRIERLTLLGWTCVGLMGGDDGGLCSVGDLCGVPPGSRSVTLYEMAFGGQQNREVA